MEDRCICCGEIIPEGRQVCPSCEEKANNQSLREIRGLFAYEETRKEG